MIYDGYDFLIVCSAGNQTDKGKVYDASYGSMLTSITDKLVKSRILVVGNMGYNCREGKSDLFAFNTTVCPVKSFYGERVDVCAPGSNIYACIPFNSYGLCSGTSMSSPYIAGIAAMMYAENPNLCASEVKETIIKNVNERINSKFSIGMSVEYYPIGHVLDREDLLKYPVPDAEKCVQYAIDSKDRDKEKNEIGNGMIMGTLRDNLYKTGIESQILIINEDNGMVFTTSSNEKGEFDCVLPEGTYKIGFWSNSEYMPLSMTKVVYSESITYVEAYEIKWKNTSGDTSSKYKLSGSVNSLLTDKAIADAKVFISKGLIEERVDYSLGLREHAVTDKEGKFEVQLPAGYYTVWVKKESISNGCVYVYVTSDTEVNIAMETCSLNGNIKQSYNGAGHNTINPMSGIDIRLSSNSEYGESWITKTDINGNYFFSDFPKGEYIISIKLKGTFVEEKEIITFDIGEKKEFNKLIEFTGDDLPDNTLKIVGSPSFNPLNELKCLITPKFDNRDVKDIDESEYFLIDDGFKFKSLSGEYYIILKKEGYRTKRLDVVSSEKGIIIVDGTLLNTPGEVNVFLQEEVTSLTIDITSYLSGGSEKNVEMYYGKGLGISISECNIIKEVDKSINLSLASGEYTFYFNKEGYITIKKDIIVQDDGTILSGGEKINEKMSIELMPDRQDVYLMHGYVWRGKVPDLHGTIFTAYRHDMFSSEYEFTTNSMEERVGEIIKGSYGSNIFFFSIVLDEDEYDRIYSDYKNHQGIVKSYNGDSLHSITAKDGVGY